MAEAVLDEDLAEGLSQAKKTPRNFALIVKGVTPVKLMVRKKQFREAELMKAKTEAKGNDIITGVLQASGSDFAFQVVGDAEPAVTTLKLKELISEQTEMTAKPRWELVKELPAIAGEEDDQSEQKSGKVSTAQVTPGAVPTTPSLDASQLLAAMNKLSPQIQAAAKNLPDRKSEMLQQVAAFQQHIKEAQLEQARQMLGQLVILLKTIGTAPTAESSANPLVKFAKIRLDWDAAKKAVQSKIAELHAEIVAGSDDPEDALAAKNLDKLLARFSEGLGDTMDEMRNIAEPAEQRRLASKVVEIADHYLDFLQASPLVTHVEVNPYEVAVAVRETLAPPLNNVKQGVTQLVK